MTHAQPVLTLGQRVLVEMVIDYVDEKSVYCHFIGCWPQHNVLKEYIHPLPAKQLEAELTFAPMCVCGHDQGWHSESCDFFGCQCAAFRDKNLPAEQGWQWLLIESAPKDGTAVIIGCLKDGKVWNLRQGVWTGIGWYEVHSGAGINYPTHWLPLPPAPTSAKAGGGV